MDKTTLPGAWHMTIMHMYASTLLHRLIGPELVSKQTYSSR